ncbi:MAG: polysaccharide biosynthesis protein [Lachnospiraceae bacterium]|nr:polysaccharide biosynthesis protein [Lachnospiraceae bacterium]
MKLFQNKLIKGTIILAIAGVITRIIGFFYRIFLAGLLGSELLGIYQLVFPIYSICFTIYGAGIQTAISQITGTVTSKKNQGYASPLKILVSGMVLSLGLSLLLMALVYSSPVWIAENILLEKSCAPYLKIMALLFPFCSISACISGYYYGIQNASVPAGSQIIEQLSRVLFVYIICTFAGSGKEFNAIIAVCGLVTGEICGCIFSIARLFISFHNAKSIKTSTGRTRNLNRARGKHPVFKTLLSLSVILTTTKLIVSLLHSAEAVFIPAALQKYGCSPADALSIYGILSGMAMPFILFPSAISNSFAVMLLPSIAQAQADKNSAKIRKSVTFATKYNLLVGWLCICIFIIFGDEMGTLFFHNADAGSYIVILSWLCPFLYVSTAFTSIINGMGHTQFTFIITVLSLILKIYFLVALVPLYGIKAYLAGMLASQVIMAVMEGFYLRDYIVPDGLHWIILPCLFLVFAGKMSHKIYNILLIIVPGTLKIPLLFLVCTIILACYIIFLLASKCISREELANK